MKTIKSLKDITTLEVGDVIVFGNLEYVVDKNIEHNSTQYYLYCPTKYNGTIFEILNFRKKDFVEKLGINNGDMVFIDTKFTITESDFIKSRFIDDKASASMLQRR